MSISSLHNFPDQKGQSQHAENQCDESRMFHHAIHGQHISGNEPPPSPLREREISTTKVDLKQIFTQVYPEQGCAWLDKEQPRTESEWVNFLFNILNKRVTECNTSSVFTEEVKKAQEFFISAGFQAKSQQEFAEKCFSQDPHSTLNNKDIFAIENECWTKIVINALPKFTKRIDKKFRNLLIVALLKTVKNALPNTNPNDWEFLLIKLAQNDDEHMMAQSISPEESLSIRENIAINCIEQGMYKDHTFSEICQMFLIQDEEARKNLAYIYLKHYIQSKSWTCENTQKGDEDATLKDLLMTYFQNDPYSFLRQNFPFHLVQHAIPSFYLHDLVDSIDLKENFFTQRNKKLFLKIGILRSILIREGYNNNAKEFDSFIAYLKKIFPQEGIQKLLTRFLEEEQNHVSYLFIPTMLVALEKIQTSKDIIEWLIKNGLLWGMAELRDEFLSYFLLKQTIVALQKDPKFQTTFDSFPVQFKDSKKGKEAILKLQLAYLQKFCSFPQECLPNIAKILQTNKKALYDSVKFIPLVQSLEVLICAPHLSEQEKTALFSLWAHSISSQNMIEGSRALLTVLRPEETEPLRAVIKESRELTIPDLQKLSEDNFKKKLQLDEGEMERYREKFGQSRHPTACISLVCEWEYPHDLKLLRDNYLIAVCYGTFFEKRYDQKNNPHLTKAFQNHPKLKEQWMTLPPAQFLKKNEKSFIIKESDDPFDLLFFSVDIPGICVHPENDVYNQGILRYLINGKHHIIIVVDEKTTRILAKATFCLLLDEEEQSVLFLGSYYESNRNTPYKEHIMSLAKERARTLQLPLFVENRDSFSHADHKPYQKCLYAYKGRVRDHIDGAIPSIDTCETHKLRNMEMVQL